jgi:hypothetical protein
MTRVPSFAPQLRGVLVLLVLEKITQAARLQRGG